MISARPESTTLLAAAGIAAGSVLGPCLRPGALEPCLALAAALLAIVHSGRGRAALACAGLALAAHAAQDSHSSRIDGALRALRSTLARSERCELEGGVEDSWGIEGGGQRLRARLERLGCGSAPAPARGQFLLTIPGGGEAFEPGDRIGAHARLYEIRPPGNPGGFDSAALLRGRGVFLGGSVKARALARRLPLAADAPRCRLARLRVRLHERLSLAFGRLQSPDPESVPLLSALLLGVRSEPGSELGRGLQASGLYHLVAISGLHVALLGWILLRLSGALLPRPAAAAVAAAGLGTYVLVVGAPASAVRALWMLLLWELGRHTGRRPSGMAIVAVTGAALLLARPGLRADPGFWLSVCATAGIVALPRAPGRSGAARAAGLRRALAISLAAYVCVAPLQALWFQRWTPVGIALNLPAVPLSALLLAAALALAALGGAAAATPVALLADLGVRALGVLSLPSVCDRELFRIPPPPAPLLGAHLCAAAGAATARTRAPWWALLGTAHLALLLPAAPALPPAALEVTLWDVGQGESVLLRFADHSAVLIDTGGRMRGGDSAAERWVLPALRASGVRTLRALALSHLDSDHAAGAPEIARALGPGEIWASRSLGPDERRRLLTLAARHGALLRLWARGGGMARGAGEVQVLAPEGDAPAGGGANAGSLVLRAGEAPHTLLLTGDLDGRGERLLVARGLEPAAVLKVAHHGSRGSSGAGFLRAVGARAALISAGPRNAWGHPHPETLERLRRSGAAVVSTSRGGAVRARLEAGRARLERWESGAWRLIERLDLGPRGAGRAHPADAPRPPLGACPSNDRLLRKRDASPGTSSRTPRSSAETTPSGFAPRPRCASRFSRRRPYSDRLLAEHLPDGDRHEREDQDQDRQRQQHAAAGAEILGVENGRMPVADHEQEPRPQQPRHDVLHPLPADAGKSVLDPLRLEEEIAEKRHQGPARGP